MQKLTFYIVDVFAEEKYSGNELAVVRDAKRLSDSEMQKIAKEMHFSETAFILSDREREGGYDVRIFTPENELPFAGHPTLGTAYVIQHEIIKNHISEVALNLKVGKIPVTFSYVKGRADVLWMKQVKPTFGKIFDAQTLSKVLNLEVRDFDDSHPIEEVSTGVPFIIVPLKNLSTLKKARLAREGYFELIKDTSAKSILIFCPQTRVPENNMSVRVFTEYYGIPEDPATGSGNGCLAGYLVRHRYFGEDKIDIRVEQGYEIGRPSLLLLRAEDRRGEIEVHVGGRIKMVARGKLV